MKYLIAITMMNFLQAEAESTFVGHTQCVSSVVWPEHDVIYSSSWDHSVRRWDVDTGKETLNLVCLSHSLLLSNKFRHTTHLSLLTNSVLLCLFL